MAKQIFTVFSCDNWKSNDSMQLICCTTSLQKLKSFIAKKIEDDTFVYGDSSMTKKEQISLFKNHFATEVRSTVNDNICGGYYDYCYDGEEI